LQVVCGHEFVAILPKTPRNSNPTRKRGNSPDFLAYASGYE
jgi:hypothetical protein